MRCHVILTTGKKVYQCLHDAGHPEGTHDFKIPYPTSWVYIKMRLMWWHFTDWLDTKAMLYFARRNIRRQHKENMRRRRKQ